MLGVFSVSAGGPMWLLSVVTLTLFGCGVQDNVREASRSFKQSAAQAVERKAVDLASKHLGFDLPIRDIQLREDGASMSLNGLPVNLSTTSTVPAGWSPNVQPLAGTAVDSTIDMPGAAVVLTSGPASPKDMVEAHKARCGAACAQPMMNDHQPDGSTAVYMLGERILFAHAMLNPDAPGSTTLALAEIDINAAAQIAGSLGVDMQGAIEGLQGGDALKQLQRLQSGIER